MTSAAPEQPSASSTASSPPLPTHSARQPIIPANNATAAADTTTTAPPEPSAYVAPLMAHLDNYRAVVIGKLDQYARDLAEFDRVAVTPWLSAATRHLKQQEDTKRDMSENGQRIRAEIAEFAAKMQQWRGGLANRAANNQQRSAHQ